MAAREVKPELLDHLPADDPGAVRSRRDLRCINVFMGNERWIRRAVKRFPEAVSRGIVEIGAGDGSLAGSLALMFPGAAVTACDLAARPAHLAEQVEWKQGDVFALDDLRGGVLVANLFLHHFEGSALRELGLMCDRFDVLVFNEPDRARIPHWLGWLAHPFIHPVTRHDMYVSINAGFSHGELARFMGLDGKWRLEETSTWRGARRVLAWRA